MPTWTYQAWRPNTDSLTTERVWSRWSLSRHTAHTVMPSQSLGGHISPSLSCLLNPWVTTSLPPYTCIRYVTCYVKSLVWSISSGATPSSCRCYGTWFHWLDSCLWLGLKVSQFHSQNATWNKEPLKNIIFKKKNNTKRDKKMTIHTHTQMQTQLLPRMIE